MAVPAAVSARLVDLVLHEDVTLGARADARSSSEGGPLHDPTRDIEGDAGTGRAFRQVVRVGPDRAVRSCGVRSDPTADGHVVVNDGEEQRKGAFVPRQLYVP